MPTKPAAMTRRPDEAVIPTQAGKQAKRSFELAAIETDSTGSPPARGRWNLPKRLALALLPAALLTTGCSMLPDFVRPAAPVAQQWPQPEQTVGQTPAVGLSWHQMLPDPRLQALIEAALANNRDLRMSVARVEEARALYGVSRADRLPTVNASVSESAARVPADLSSSGSSYTSRRWDVALGVTAFELDFWGRVKSLNEAAKASYLASAEARDAFRVSLIADVAAAYFGLQELDERLALTRATVANRKDLSDLVAKRRDVGLAGDLDYLAANGAYETARADLANLERSRAQADNALTLLVGGQPGTLPEGRPLRDQNLVGDLAASVPSEALLARPDVRAAEQRLVAANANIGAARAAFLPRLGISLSAGTASSSLSGLFDSGSGAWSFAPSLVQPLFDAGRNRANLDLAEARKVIAVADYEKTIQQAFREVADLLAARDRLAQQIQAQAATEKAQSDRLALVQARQEAGASSYLEVLDAQRDAYAAQQGTVQLRSALLVANAQLYKALGGGLDPAPTTP